MIADRILNKLDGVKQTGNDRWLAKCPAHEDKSPSLAIREIEDRLLLHCFAGCSAHEIVASIGLELSDLFPEQIKTEGSKPLSKPFPAQDILRAMSSDITFFIVCASDIAKGETLDDESRDYLLRSASRFRAALQAGGIV